MRRPRRAAVSSSRSSASRCGTRGSEAPSTGESGRLAGVSPDTLQTLADLGAFPVVTKDELRAAQAARPPFGDYLCIPPEAVARIHGTSGTTGRPTVFGIGPEDWGRIGEAHARIMWAIGIRPGDRVLIGSFFSLYMGSWGALAGGERLGATMFPFGAGVQGQTLAAVQWAREIRPTAFYGTPSYALHFAETARREGVDPRSLGLRILFFSGEPGAGIPSTKRLIEDAFGGTCVDTGSMAEMTPWMTNAECQFRAGMHLWQDLVYTEVCDPETYRPVPYGSEGTPIYTHLERTSQPMIRLVSGDRTRWTDDPCPCGRTYPRLPAGIYGRFDDMLVVRGENVYPSGIEDALRAIPGFGGEFRVIVSRREAMDELLVRAEYTPEHEPSERRDALQRAMRERLRARIGIHPVIELVPAGHASALGVQGSPRRGRPRSLSTRALRREGPLAMTRHRPGRRGPACFTPAGPRCPGRRAASLSAGRGSAETLAEGRP